MAYWRRLLVGVVGVASLIGAGTVSVAADEGGTVTEFDAMTAITGSAVGAVNDRGIAGGGLPWKITAGSGTLDRDGHLKVSVTGLVLAGPGINPIPKFQAVVSCRTTDNAIVNVETGSFTATVPGGDTTIDAMLSLPHPCTRAEVFVGGSPRGTFVWFAQSNPHD
jgi:hypothetical protein